MHTHARTRTHTHALPHTHRHARTARCVRACLRERHRACGVCAVRAHTRTHTLRVRTRTAHGAPQPPTRRVLQYPPQYRRTSAPPPHMRTARARAAYRYVSFASELIQLPIVPVKRFEPSPLRSTARAHERTDRRSGPCRAFPPDAKGRAHSVSRSVSAPSAAGTAPLSWFPLADLPRADVSREYIRPGGAHGAHAHAHAAHHHGVRACISVRYVYMCMHMYT